MAYMYLPPTNAEKRIITLLHGKNFNGAYWERLANKLNSLGYNVLIPDQIGFGKSSVPVTFHTPTSKPTAPTRPHADAADLSNAAVRRLRCWAECWPDL